MATQNFRVKNGLEVGIGATILVAENNGNIGINSTAPTQKLDVVGTARIDGLIFGSGTEVTSVDADLNAVSASHDTLASAKAIKSYVDQQITAEDLDFSGDSGTGSVDLDSQSLSISGTTNEIETSASGQTLTIGLPDKVSIASTLTVNSSTTIDSSGIDISTNLTVDGLSDLDELNVSGLSTFSSNVDINAGLDVDGFTELDATNISETLSVSGLSTFSSNVDVNANLDVDGFTELDATNISETLSVSGLSTFSSNVDINADLDVDGFTELDATNISETLSVSGLSTFSSNVDIDADLDVDGHTELDDVNVSGVSTFAGAIDANGDLDVDGHTELDDVNVSGVSTFAGAIDANGSLDVDGHTELDDVNVSGAITATTFTGNLAGTVNTAAQPNITSLGTLSALTVSGDITANGNIAGDGATNITGIASVTATTLSGTLQTAAQTNVTSVGTLTGLDVNGHSELDDVNVSGVSTFTGAADFNGSIDVDGHTELDNVNVSGAITATTFTGNLAGTVNTAAQPNITSLGTLSALTVSGDITANGDIVGDNSTNITGIAGVTATTLSGTLQTAAQTNVTSVGTLTGLDVNGHSELDDVNVSGALTATSLNVTDKLITTGIGISIANGAGNTAYIEGPSEIWIDPHPFGVGQTSGSVRIRGDLYVDGTEFIVDVDKIQLGDFRIGIATTAGTNALLDGGGLGIGSESIEKTITWNNATSALMSSENWNLASGKHYEIAGTDVLTSDTLGSGIINSSLTSVGTLGALTVSGDVTANGNIVGDNATNISGINSVTATSFYGSGANLTSVPNGALDNSSVSYGGVTLNLGDTDATPAFDLSDATNYPYTSLTGISTEILYDTTPQLGGDLDLNSNNITGTGNVNITGVITATTFSGSGASLTSIPNSALDNSSVSYGGVELSLGGSDATPAFDLSDATNYPYTSLTGISTEILYDTTPQLGGNLDLNSNDITGTGDVNITGVITATTFSGSGANLTSVPNGALDNSSVSYGGVTLNLGDTDATPAFDLSDATNYPYTSLTGISTEILGDTTPQLGGDLDLNSKFITGTGGINVSGIITATTFSGSGANLTSVPNGALDNSSIAIGGLTLNLGDTDATPAFDLSDATNYPYTSLTGISTEILYDTTPQLGGNLDLNSNNITGTGNMNVTGIITATSFDGNITGDITGNADTATKLETSRNFEITGDFITAPSIGFDGTDNVSLAATITTNSIALGTYTTGDYVESISGTSNQITVTSGTGEGSTPVISIPNNPTLPGTTVTVATDLQVNRNLNVTGNITIGGTSATLFTQTLSVADADLILGVRTDANGNDVSTDTTANHGGIAIASTEGTPLVTLANPGAGETLPPTYKKIMWFEQGSFTGLGTDAWLINYGVGIGSTQVPNNVVLAAGDVHVTNNDIKKVRDINSSGIVTATTFSGSGASLTSIPNGALTNSSIAIGGVTLNLGDTDATPAFDLSDATAYPYTSLTGITTEILGDTTPQLGGDLDLNSNNITGTGNVNITGVITATTFSGSGASLTSIPNGALTNSSIAIGGVTLNLGDTDATPAFDLSDSTNYPYTSLTGISTEILYDTTPQLGGNLDLNSNDITGTGDVNITGVITATSFDGNITGDITGNADTATKLETSRNFEITGDVVASQISFDGTGNVSLAATIQPNSVALATDTTGDFVQSITGTANEVTVSVTSGENSTPQIGLPNDVTIGQDLTVTRNIDVDGHTELDDVNVSGVSTFTGATDFNGDVDIDGHTELDGVNVSETLSVSGLSTFSSNVDVNASVDISTNLTVDGLSDLDELNVSGVSTFGGNVNLGDDNRLRLGDSQDLEIYHDGSHSYIDDVGTGNLFLRSETLSIQNLAGNKTSALFQSGSGQELYFNNSKKFETVGGGVSVSSGTASTATIYGPGNLIIDPAPVDDNGGIVRIKGDLYVDGTTTEINSTTLTINDLNIVVASGSTNSTAADGAGITVDGASATLQYATSGDKWVFNKVPYYNSDRLLTTADEGSGNGIDADTLDGQEGTYYLDYANFSGIATDSDKLDGQQGTYYLNTSGTSQTKTGDLTINGNLGLGTSPSQKLDVNGAVRLRGAVYDNNNSTGTSSKVLKSTVTGVEWGTLADLGGISGVTIADDNSSTSVFNIAFTDSSGTSITEFGVSSSNLTYKPEGKLGIGTSNPSVALDVNGDLTVSGIITATTFSGSGASLTSIPNSALVNSSIAIGGVTLNLGDTDATPAFDLSDSTNYPYTSLTGISTEILYDTTPQLGGNLDLNSNDITGTGEVNITGVITATTFSGSGASLTSIPNSALVNSSIAIGGVTLNLGDTDATPAFDLSDATNYPYTSLTGISTEILYDTTPQLGGDLDLNSNNINGTGGINITGIITATTFSGSGASLTSIPNSALDNSSIAIGGLTLNLGDTDATPAFDLSDGTNYPYTSLTGISTEILYDTTPQLGGNLDLNSNDITGTGDVNITGIITATTFSGNLPTIDLTGTITNDQLNGSITNDKLVNSSVSYGGVTLNLGDTDATPAFDLSDATNYPYTSLTGISTEILYDTTPQLGGNLDLNSNDITGTGEVNITGVITATEFHTGAEGSAIRVTNNTISGPAELFIDPSAVGDDTGAVRIKGDLYVDGTTTQINSTTIELADFIVGIATTATTDSLADGAGITIGPDNTLLYDHSNTSLKSSENLNLATGKTYKINGTDVLSSTTLGSNVVNSSLTSVGTLTELNVSGIITSTTFSGSGASLTSIPNSALDNSSIAIGGVTLNLGDTDATPAFDLSDATNYPFTSLTGIATHIVGDTTPQLGGNLDLNSNDITGTGDVNITGVITATTFSGSGASLTDIPNGALTNSSIAIGGVTLNLGDTDATPAFDLSDATNYPFTSLTGIATHIVGDTTPQLGGNLDLNNNLINGTGGITITGVTTSTDFNTTSDQNLKTNIQTIEDPLEKIVQIRGVNFEWKENNKPSAGVIAQEVEKVLPQLVNGNDTKTVNYNGLIGLLIETVKEQQKQIDNLNTRLSKLE